MSQLKSASLDEEHARHDRFWSLVDYLESLKEVCPTGQGAGVKIFRYPAAMYNPLRADVRVRVGRCADEDVSYSVIGQGDQIKVILRDHCVSVPDDNLLEARRVALEPVAELCRHVWTDTMREWIATEAETGYGLEVE